LRISDSATIHACSFLGARPDAVCENFIATIQRIHELVDLDGFGEIVEESGLEALRDTRGTALAAERIMMGICAVDGSARRSFMAFDPADAGQVMSIRITSG